MGAEHEPGATGEKGLREPMLSFLSDVVPAQPG
jgi:hypothetical protein